MPNAANGVKFGEWVDWNGAFDPVPTAQIRLTVSSPLKLQAIFTAHWKSVRSYDDRSGNGPYNYLCDGYWKILYTVSNGKITMYPWTTYGSNWGPTVKSHGTLLDFSKPVDGDIGEIAVLGQKLIHECPTIRQVKIPASVTTIKDGAFLGMHRDTVFEIAGAPELVIGAITGRISGLRLTGGFPTFNYNYGIRSIKDVGDYEMWIAVPKHDPLWKEKCLDTTVVTPWKKLSADVQAKFFENFPDEKRRPFGLSRGKYPFNNQLYSWIFREGLAHPLMLIFK